MKRNKVRKVSKSYQELKEPPKTPESQREEELKRFLEKGGIIYKAHRGRRKDGLTKTKISEHNKNLFNKTEDNKEDEKIDWRINALL